MPMKRRSLPIWLLRDVPAFLGVMISFWPLMILVIRNGFAAMRGKKISKSVFDQLPIFLAHAESRLDFALWREAYRRLGWNPRAISFELFSAPEDWADTARRFENYRRACTTLEACARGYVEHLRAQHSLSQREAMNAGACPLRLAARSTSPARRAEQETSHGHRSLASLAARRGSNHVDQVQIAGVQGVPLLRTRFAASMIFRMTATRTTLGGLPRAVSRSAKALRPGSVRRAASAAM